MSLVFHTSEHHFHQPQTLHIKMFNSKSTLIRHLCDHIWNENEPWDRLLNKRMLSQARKKWEEQGVIEQGFYDDLVKMLDENLISSAQKPLYVWALQQRDGAICKSLFALGRKGLIMVVSGNVLRTAYFTGSQSKNSASGQRSNYDLFEKAWFDIKRKLSWREYDDSKGDIRVVNLKNHWFSEENWDKCPNPYKPPKKRTQMREKSPEELVFEWYSDKEEW